MSKCRWCFAAGPLHPPAPWFPPLQFRCLRHKQQQQRQAIARVSIRASCCQKTLVMTSTPNAAGNNEGQQKSRESTEGHREAEGVRGRADSEG